MTMLGGEAHHTEDASQFYPVRTASYVDNVIGMLASLHMDVVVLRSSDPGVVDRAAEANALPIINGGSLDDHPTQALVRHLHDQAGARPRRRRGGRGRRPGGAPERQRSPEGSRPVRRREGDPGSLQRPGRPRSGLLLRGAGHHFPHHRRRRGRPTGRRPSTSTGPVRWPTSNC